MGLFEVVRIRARLSDSRHQVKAGEYESWLFDLFDAPSMGWGGGRAGWGTLGRVGLPSWQHSALLQSHARGRDGSTHRYALVGGTSGAMRVVAGGANRLAGDGGLRVRFRRRSAERSARHPRFHNRQRPRGAGSLVRL